MDEGTVTPHVADELPLLLSGEATRAAVLAAALHLRGCEDCRTELVSAVVAHASLTSARRFAPEVLAPELRAVVTAATRPVLLPDLSGVFEQVRAETAEAAEPARPAKRRRPTALLAVAAVVAGAVVGTGITYAATRGGSSDSSGRSVALAAYPVGRVSGTATLSGGDHMVIDATALPQPARGHRYEVWLTNSARTAMQPVGWINERGRASLDVPSNLMAAFSDIEVSVQRVNSEYAYSGTSVLRGSY